MGRVFRSTFKILVYKRTYLKDYYVTLCRCSPLGCKPCPPPFGLVIITMVPAGLAIEGAGNQLLCHHRRDSEFFCKTFWAKMQMRSYCLRCDSHPMLLLMGVRCYCFVCSIASLIPLGHILKLASCGDSPLCNAWGEGFEESWMGLALGDLEVALVFYLVQAGVPSTPSPPVPTSPPPSGLSP